MLKLELWRLLEASETLIVERGHFERGAQILLTRPSGTPMRMDLHHFEKLRTAIQDIERISREAGLTSTHMAADRTRKFFEQVGEPRDGSCLLVNQEQSNNCYLHLEDIASRIRDDCKSRIYFQIAPSSQSLLDETIDHFGDAVRLAFGDAAEDIAEAAACLALERPTACVFHLMRALEVAASVVADKLGATIRDEHGKGLSWGVIASNMKPKIDKMAKGSDEQVNWYRVHSMLESVGRAWRNPTAHPKKTYTLEEARRVFEATRAFMQELAPLV